MKKAIRIILSPLVFIVVFGGINGVIPVGILCLFMGLGSAIYNWIMDNKEKNEWDIIFACVTIPYITTKEFIEGKKSSW